MRRKVTYRLRIPVSTATRRRRRGRLSGGRVSRRRLKGGFLPALIPIIAAAVGAIPGIASVAVQAARKN
ncbi:pX [Tree shrew adenovirus 1]|uniref:PX n=1 Tax=Tree shrew adenovirus serotype 1 TaxID=47680 RepID=A0A2U9AG85_ADET1|nr:pX [Tree shrew adenovirus 1]AWO77106.1 pX [Tree shrew adenovirus 1]